MFCFVFSSIFSISPTQKQTKKKQFKIFSSQILNAKKCLIKTPTPKTLNARTPKTMTVAGTEAAAEVYEVPTTSSANLGAFVTPNGHVVAQDEEPTESDDTDDVVVVNYKKSLKPKKKLF